MSTSNSNGSGALVYRVWIGVTGHRWLTAEPELISSIRLALARAVELASSDRTEVRIGLVTALAEGADRIVAHEVLTYPGAALEAALPRHRAEYAKDFGTDESKAEFLHLLDHARPVVVPAPGLSREEAYRATGRYVVDRCDALIAVWDGAEPKGIGGTAEIVRYAKDTKVPVFWIEAGNSYRLDAPNDLTGVCEQLDEIDRFNSVALSGGRLTRESDRCVSGWVDSASSAELAPAVDVGRIARWCAPTYVRADLLAERFHRRYLRLGDALAYGTVAAVTLAAIQVVFTPHAPLLALAEASLMVILLGLVIYARTRKILPRWISYRALAERIRSGFFLATAAAGTDRTAESDHVPPPDHSDDWIRRSFDEVWLTRPAIDIPAAAVEPLKRFLARAWVDSQASYHRRIARRDRRRDRGLTVATLVLFGIALAAALLHSGELLGEDVDHWLAFATIVLPALAGALASVRWQREYQRRADQSTAVVTKLDQLARELDQAPDLATVQQVAKQVGTLMLTENRDWLGLVQVHELEPL